MTFHIYFDRPHFAAIYRKHVQPALLHRDRMRVANSLFTSSSSEHREIDILFPIAAEYGIRSDRSGRKAAMFRIFTFAGRDRLQPLYHCRMRFDDEDAVAVFRKDAQR